MTSRASSDGKSQREIRFFAVVGSGLLYLLSHQLLQSWPWCFVIRKGLIVFAYGDALNSTLIDGKEIGKILESLACSRKKKGEKLNYIRNIEDNSEFLFQELTVVLGHLRGLLSWRCRSTNEDWLSVPESWGLLVELGCSQLGLLTGCKTCPPEWSETESSQGNFS